MKIEDIEDYELPLSSHASKGTAIYCIVFVISLCAMEVESASPYVLYGAMLLLALNHFYWYFKDHQTYSTYKSNYISTLDQLDVAHILALDQHVRFTDGVGLWIYFLTKHF